MERQVDDHARDLRSVLGSDLGLHMLVHSRADKLLLVPGGTLHECRRAKHARDLLGIGLRPEQLGVHLLGRLRHRSDLLLVDRGETLSSRNAVWKRLLIRNRSLNHGCVHRSRHALESLPRSCLVVDLPVLLDVGAKASSRSSSHRSRVSGPSLILVHRTHQQTECLQQSHDI